MDAPRNQQESTGSGQVASSLSFTIEARLPGAGGRAGTLTLPHGTVETPAFMVVGTQATVKSLTPDEVRGARHAVILGNTYHLYLRPGADLVAQLRRAARLHGLGRPDPDRQRRLPGLQPRLRRSSTVSAKLPRSSPASGRPAGRSGPARELTRIDDDGVTFTSHLDGSRHRFTPELSIGIQQQLGADMILAFDECTSPLHDEPYTARALERTHRWADRCLAAWSVATIRHSSGSCRAARMTLRLQSAEFFAARRSPATASAVRLAKTRTICAPDPGLDAADLAARASPRHLLGIGDPQDFSRRSSAESISFDCVAPTRLARHGALYTADGRLQIKGARYIHDRGPIEEGCGCSPASRYSRGYLRHLFMPGRCWISASPRSTISTSSSILSAPSGRVSSMGHSLSSATVSSPAIWHRAKREWCAAGRGRFRHGILCRHHHPFSTSGQPAGCRCW